MENLSKEKQIEEMAVDMCLIDMCKHLPQEECHNTTCAHCEAEALYNAGYRKQSEGEWIAKTDYAGYGYYCSNCNMVFKGENAEWIAKEHLYCPKCGAKMKGGVEDEIQKETCCD